MGIVPGRPENRTVSGLRRDRGADHARVCYRALYVVESVLTASRDLIDGSAVESFDEDLLLFLQVPSMGNNTRAMFES